MNLNFDYNQTISTADAGCHGVFLFTLLQATNGSTLKLLIRLLDDNDRVGGIGGDPGWMIDRRKPFIDPSEFSEWPEWAEYHAYVPEEEVTFHCQREYISKERFENCLRRVLAARGIKTAPYEY